MSPPDARLFLSSHCPHCPAMLAILADLVKTGKIGRLDVINVERHPELAQAKGIRSVPWVGIGPFELSGARPRAELEEWIIRAGSESGMADYLHALLKEGELARVLSAVKEQPELLQALLPIMANPEASLNVRIGAGAVFEDMAGSEALAALTPRLGDLSTHDDARVRADACHTLSLTRSIAARPYLLARLGDADADVREIAEESLALLLPG
jgi:thioredoxin-like negative regulator of GroEL